MIKQIIQLLILLLVGEEQKPPYDLHKRKEPPITLKGLDKTFIILALAMVLFFALIWIFQIGNPYPNDLMSGNLTNI